MPSELGPGGAAEAGLDAFLRARAAEPDGVAVLGPGDRVFHGWPDDEGTEADFPRVGYRVISDPQNVPGYHTVRVAVDCWAWPTSKPGQRAPRRQLLVMDTWVLRVLTGARYTYDGVEVEVWPTGSPTDHPGERNRASRRSRFYLLEAAEP